MYPTRDDSAVLTIRDITGITPKIILCVIIFENLQSRILLKSTSDSFLRLLYHPLGLFSSVGIIFCNFVFNNYLGRGYNISRSRSLVLSRSLLLNRVVS